ncbi:zinc finger C2H2 domain protein [Pacmanvirus S19]|nr:zinc finger C2H2 domain protein [Pacmanvirus S19]
MEIVIHRFESMQNGELVIPYLRLSKLPESSLWEKVTFLNCSGNNLSQLTELPNIRYLDCSSNNLTYLPELPNVKWLFCSYNYLQYLPKLPNIRELSCEYNNLTYLPNLSNIENLYCGNNKLTYLPEIPKVIELRCVDNQLTYLPELPNVQELYCGRNLITELPELPKLVSTKLIYSIKNPLLFKPKHYKYVHQIRKISIMLSVIKQWRKFNQKSIKNKKQSLHNELLYSPDLPFYLEHLKARHLFEQS